jgi:tripartite-type tricarboxylate transporter receptor subunit TctC
MRRVIKSIAASATFLVLLTAFASPVLAQKYPERPVHIVVGFPAGSGPDLIARVVADELQKIWGTSVVADNKPGAAGLIAAQEVARTAEPDGHTLLLGEVGQLSIAPSSYANLAYDPAKDFAAISYIVSSDFALVTPTSVPAKNLAGYLEWAKGQDRLLMGTFGAGTPGHFGAAILGDVTDIEVEPVHYKSTGDAMSGVLRGDVQGLFGSLALVAPQVKADKITALATTGPGRSSVLPDVPTFKELGHEDLTFSAWFGLVAPAGTPPTILDQVNTAVVQAVQTLDVRKKLAEAGFSVTGTSREAFADLMREETARWAKVVQDTGFQALQ